MDRDGENPMHEVIGGCPLDCPDACSWVVTVDDEGQAVKLRGNVDHPFTQGGLCVKVNPYLEWAASPDRLLRPLRRVGAKGEGRFEEVSWDDALGEIADRFQHSIDTWGAESIWPYAGTGTVGFIQGVVGAGKRLFHHLGATRHIPTICSVSGHVGMSYTTGSAAGMDPEDLQHADLVLLWGTNTLTTNQHLWPFIEQARSGGARIVVIDPVRTRTADRADVHLAPRPGTDAALAFGLMAELGRLTAWDEAWLRAHSLGWDEFRETELMGWSAERAAEICGVGAGEICALARQIADAGVVGIRSSMGMQRHRGGGQAMRVLSCLPAVTGDYGRVGGGLCYSTSPAYGLNVHALTRPDLQPGPTRSLAMTRLGHGLLDVDDPPVKALMIWAANPVVSNPDQGRVRAGLGRDDLFTVVVEHVHTDTTAYADIVLPGTVQTEHDDLHDSFSHLYLNWNNAAVAPAGEALPHTEIFRRLGAAMGLTEPALFATDEELARAALRSEHRSIAGIDFETLRTTGWARLGDAAPYQPFADGFPTESGRFEFASARADADGVGRLPHYVAPLEAAADDDGFALVAPANHHILNSTFSGSDRHGRAGVATIAVHPSDAEAHGIGDGDAVEAFNERGSFRASVRVTDAVRCGVAMTTKGLRPDGGTSVNATVLEADSDMGRGAVYHDNRVWLRRIGMLTHALVVIALGLVALSDTARAHTELVGSCPGQGEVMSELDGIELVFASPIEATAAQPPMIALATGDGRTDLEIGPAGQTDVNVLRAAVPTRPQPGVYLIRFQVLSFDGDLNDGGFQFTFDPADDEATNCAPATADEGGTDVGGWILLGGGTAALLIVGFLLRPRGDDDVDVSGSST